MAPNSLEKTVRTALLKPQKELGIWLVPATASLTKCWLMSSTPTQYLRLTNNWVLIPPTRPFLFEEVFACLLPDSSFLHWTLPGFNHFPSSYLQTHHSSCSCSTIFSAICPFKRIVLLQNDYIFLQPWTTEDCSTSDTTIHTSHIHTMYGIMVHWEILISLIKSCVDDSNLPHYFV